MFIDAGASVLEMDNRTLVEGWLKIDTETQAAVYFDRDRAMVKYRQGWDAPLLATPFVENIDECLVSIDEVHTRGTDLKLPPIAVGAVTLDLSQAKDHTVQSKRVPTPFLRERERVCVCVCVCLCANNISRDETPPTGNDAQHRLCRPSRGGTRVSGHSATSLATAPSCRPTLSPG